MKVILIDERLLSYLSNKLTKTIFRGGESANWFALLRALENAMDADEEKIQTILALFNSSAEVKNEN